VQTSATRAAVFLLSGNRSAAFLLARDVLGLDGAPVYGFINALEQADADHSEAIRRFDAWAAENAVDLTRYPEILAAFGAYDRVNLEINAELWFWLPNYRDFRQSDRFRSLIREYGHYDLWKVKGFPP